MQGRFASDVLNRAANAGKSTAWQLSGLRTIQLGQKYMAVSHVWSDGTGAGKWPAGEVNTCLYHLFATIARSQDCDGIWWDTICVPTDKVARAKAINNMHEYYSQAHFTVVHDCFLRDIVCTDPEMACIAIIMSPWFSRGWTAVELAFSRRVRVAFKNLHRKYDLRDLDDLLRNPSTLRHRIVAEIIKGLRAEKISNLDTLLNVLHGRYTSWSRDMSIIAALLTGTKIEELQMIDGDANAAEISQHDLHRRILTTLGSIGPGHLFHNLPTVSGGKSWCPARLLALPASSSGVSLAVDEKANVLGQWKVLRPEVYSGAKYQETAHPLIAIKTKAALQRPEKHLLLVEEAVKYPRRAILVEYAGENHNGEISCQFVGAVDLRGESLETVDEFPTQKVRIHYESFEVEGFPACPSQRRATLRIESPLVGSQVPRAGESLGQVPSWHLEDVEVDGSDVPSFNSFHRDFRLERPNLDLMNAEHSLVKRSIPNWRREVHRVDTDERRDLFNAAKTGDEVRIVELLSCGTYEEILHGKLLHCDENGRTAVSWAAGEGHWPATWALLDTRCFLTIPEGIPELPNGRAPFDWSHGNFRTVCNAQDQDGLAPLSWAAALGCDSTVAGLLRYPEVFLDIPDELGWTPLWYAANNNHITVMGTLIEAGARIDSRDVADCSLLRRVAANGTKAALRLLLHHCASPESQDQYLALCDAVKLGRTSTAQILIDHKTSLWSGPYPRPYDLAISKGDLAMFKLILHTEDIRDETKGAGGPFASESVNLKRRAYSNVLELLYRRLFQESPATLDELMGLFTILGHLFETYEADDLNLNQELPGGFQLLHLAAMAGNTDWVDTVLRTGKIDVNNRAIEGGQTALYVAAERGHLSTVERLLQEDNIDLGLRGPITHMIRALTAQGIAETNGHHDVARAIYNRGKQLRPPKFDFWGLLD